VDEVDEKFVAEVFDITATLAEYCSEREITEAVEKAIEILKGVRDDAHIDCITRRFRIYRTAEGLKVEKVKMEKAGRERKKKKEVGASRG